MHDCKFQLPVADGFGLSVSLDPYLSYFALDLTLPDREPINIAWDDQAHWHPHVLRWPELDTICRASALRDEELAHPGWSVLLLHRFAPICEGDDVEAIVAILEAAWKKTGVFSDSDIATFIERIDARDAGFRWQSVESIGWCLEQEDEENASRGLYTLRRPNDTTFPFADWNRMIQCAERELARLAPTANDDHLVKLAPSAKCLPRPKLGLYLSIPHVDPSRPVPTPFGKLFNDTLDRILRDLHLGRSDPSGGSSKRNDDGTFTEVESRYFIKIKGDWAKNQPLIRDLLWWSRAPASVQISEGFKNKLPLDLEAAPSAPAPLVLHLAGLSTVRWRTGFRYDRLELTATQRQSLQHTLRKCQAVGPDHDGWFRVPLPGGGELSLCARRLGEDEELEGITICLEQLTPEASALIHRLMSDNEWMLLPLLVAADARVVGQVSESWPTVRLIETPAELHNLLTAGAFAWWRMPEALDAPKSG